MVGVAKMVCNEGCEEMVGSAEGIEDKFNPLFISFSKCHNIYSKKGKLDDQEIQELGKNGLHICNSCYLSIWFY